jgi:phasin family protein
MLQCNRAAGPRSQRSVQQPDEEVMKMVAKAKVTGDKIDGTETMETAMKNGTESFETAFKTSSEALKTGFDKAVKNYDQLLGFGKETVEAYVKSANAAGKGVETLHSELYAYSKQSVEDSISATKALMGSKSVHEAFELQTDFAKTAFESYVSQATKISELMTAAAKQTVAPLQGRVQDWVEIVQSSRAA